MHSITGADVLLPNLFIDYSETLRLSSGILAPCQDCFRSFLLYFLSYDFVAPLVSRSHGKSQRVCLSLRPVPLCRTLALPSTLSLVVRFCPLSLTKEKLVGIYNHSARTKFWPRKYYTYCSQNLRPWIGSSLASHFLFCPPNGSFSYTMRCYNISSSQKQLLSWSQPFPFHFSFVILKAAAPIIGDHLPRFTECHGLFGDRHYTFGLGRSTVQFSLYNQRQFVGSCFTFLDIYGETDSISLDTESFRPYLVRWIIVKATCMRDSYLHDSVNPKLSLATESVASRSIGFSHNRFS